MESAQERVKRLESELSKALIDAQREAVESQRRHDNMIGATFHALKAIIHIRDEGYSGEALGRAQSWSGSKARYKADGDYNRIRRQVYEWLVELDFIDSNTGLFKFSQDR